MRLLEALMRRKRGTRASFGRMVCVPLSGPSRSVGTWALELFGAHSTQDDFSN